MELIQIGFKFFTVVLLLLLALISDIATYKIKNAITYGFMLEGLASNYLTNGFGGIVFSLQGILLPVICLIILYMLGIMGAGDIKLFSALGAIMGAGFIFDTLLFSFICGGVIAAALMLKRRNGLQRLKYLLLYLKNCFATMTITRYAHFGDGQDDSRFHFSFAVAAGTAAAVLIDRLGVMLLQ